MRPRLASRPSVHVAVRGFAVEDTASLVLRFASGVLGSFIISDCAALPWAWEYTSGQALYFPQ